MLPKHIAFILDGNGRWATKRGLPRSMGHREGVKAIERTIIALIDQKIPFVTFFAFSTDNWKRSKDEINTLFSIAQEYFEKGLEFFLKYNVKVEIWGDRTKFSKKLQHIMQKVEQKTASCSKLKCGFCINYGGREDIVRAVNALLSDGATKIDMRDISSKLYSKDFPDPDLVVRTSGEQRVSNFQIWQMAYSELYFCKAYWPDFGAKHLKKSISAFSKRKRRFGGY